MATITSLHFALDAHIQLLHVKIAGFEDAIQLLAKNWKDLVAGMVAEHLLASRFNLRQIQFLSGQLQAQLNQLRLRQPGQQVRHRLHRQRSVR